MGRGRPKKENPKSKWLHIRMTEEDLAFIKAAAERCGASAAELLRTAVFDYIFRMNGEDVTAIVERAYERMGA